MQEVEGSLALAVVALILLELAAIPGRIAGTRISAALVFAAVRLLGRKVQDVRRPFCVGHFRAHDHAGRG